MGSFEGCEAFQDMMQNPDIKKWYLACKEEVTNSKGLMKTNNN